MPSLLPLLPVLVLVMLMIAHYVVHQCASRIGSPSAKELIPNLIMRTGALVAVLKSKHPTDGRTQALASWVKRNSSILPTSTANRNSVAYTINKERLYICTYDPVTGKTNDINAAMHVLLHELAHVVTAELQHPAIFWENARFLMKEAELAGLYVPLDTDTTFCGRMLKPVR
jgi:hypothetical protein